MANDYITKGYLDTKLEKFEERFTDKFEGKLTEFKGEIMNKMDEIVGMLKKKDEEEGAVAFVQKRMGDQLADHEERIKALEKN